MRIILTEQALDIKLEQSRREHLRWLAGVGVAAFPVIGLTARADQSQRDVPGSRDNACPVCGCEANHCDAGVPDHVKCSLATPSQKAMLARRQQALRRVLQEASDDLTPNCNMFVSDAAAAVGYEGFRPVVGGYRTADDLAKFLEDKGESEGWVSVEGAAITQYADSGQLVIGIIDSATVSAAKGRPEPGHTFIVEPGGTYDNSGRELKVINAAAPSSYGGGGSLPKETTLNYVLSKAALFSGNSLGTLRFYAYKNRVLTL